VEQIFKREAIRDYKDSAFGNIFHAVEFEFIVVPGHNGQMMG
jgi:hypothetical protein